MLRRDKQKGPRNYFSRLYFKLQRELVVGALVIVEDWVTYHD